MDSPPVKATERQLELLRIVAHFIDTKKYAPSRRELAILLAVTSTNTIQGLLTHLSDAGLIAYGCAKARALSITDAGREALR